ncbi:MAG TPA: ATP-binding protein [Methylomusa anaerophila]|nr:ATP-binding protein [Methylomusa anaerophila]HML88664.1 ATP-binding protein [Methylomusa anaerophila]
MTAITELNQLIIYRNLLANPVVKKLLLFLSGESSEDVRPAVVYDFIRQAEQLGLAGDVVKSYLLYLISVDENIFSAMAEKTNGQMGDSLFATARQDIAILKRFFDNALNHLPGLDMLRQYQPTSPQNHKALGELAAYFFASNAFSPDEAVRRLIAHYVQHGCGKAANVAFFRWDSDAGLQGVQNPDPIRLADIVGYEYQKSLLIGNTQAFLDGRPANNVLLVGDRGTGKSSSVKALVNEYYMNGLRLIEVPKYELRHLNKIMDLLPGRGKKYILFLDDLSFEENEAEFKYLKSVIEGGVGTKPENVLIYATSNRRHIIRENWSDSGEKSDDKHRGDTIQEKISLADRFGITLIYTAPSQDEYLQIVAGIAQRNNIGLSPAELRSEAIKWEMRHSGRSGRVARQFVQHLLGCRQ